MERFCIRSEEVEPGVIITYKLRRDQRPVHPEFVWVYSTIERENKAEVI